MSTLLAIANELVGLFVDDGALALALVAWCALVAVVAAMAPVTLAAAGPILAAGCAMILLGNVLRSGRPR